MTLRVPKSPPSVEAPSSVSVEEMEALLSDWFGGNIVLTSSGRSALLLLLQELGFGRYTHRVAVPRMISKCVLDAIVCSAFPVDAAENTAVDATIQYHQYGFTQLTQPSGFIVEDKAHSFFSQKAVPLAIFSLPKFFATTTMVGGVIAADASLANRLRERRDVFPAKSIETFAKESEMFIQGTDLSLLYTSRLLNPRIENSELGGLPTTRAGIIEIRHRREHVLEALLKAAGRLVPSGWANMLRENLPYALPIAASSDVLERLNGDLQSIGVESDTYQIDTARNMMSPTYETMLLVPYSHLVPDDVLREIETIVSRYGNTSF